MLKKVVNLSDGFRKMIPTQREVLSQRSRVRSMESDTELLNGEFFFGSVSRMRAVGHDEGGRQQAQGREPSHRESGGGGQAEETV